MYVAYVLFTREYCTVVIRMNTAFNGCVLNIIKHIYANIQLTHTKENTELTI